MESGNIIVKNTFIQVPEEDQDGITTDSLPRAFSDQSHARRPFVGHSMLDPAFAGIPEHPEETILEKVDSIERLDSTELERLRTLSRPTVDSRAFPIFQPPLMSMLNLNPIPPVPIVPVMAPLPAIGDHRWHEESASMGTLSVGRKEFTKLEFDGRLSMVTESVVHRTGIVRYLVLIVSGPVSVADGFGFVFSPSLPCKKNIQKIDSVFLNQKGRLCSRTGNELEIHNSSSIGYIDVGSIVEITIDMDSFEAIFSLYSPPKGLDTETLSILVRDDKTFSNWLVGTAALSMGPIIAKTEHAKAPVGHFCAVIKNKNTTVRFL
jgi:hypothetical protein